MNDYTNRIYQKTSTLFLRQQKRKTYNIKHFEIYYLKVHHYGATCESRGAAWVIPRGSADIMQPSQLSVSQQPANLTVCTASRWEKTYGNIP